LETAAASSGVDEPPASGAPTTGISINDLNASALMMATHELGVVGVGGRTRPGAPSLVCEPRTDKNPP
jgi:hypothetical protein